MFQTKIVFENKNVVICHTFLQPMPDEMPRQYLNTTIPIMDIDDKYKILPRANVINIYGRFYGLF
jgi:hypothetical protein